jgi:heptosyltransferase-2
LRIPVALLLAYVLRGLGRSWGGKQANGQGSRTKRIVVVRLDGMGDLVMTTPLFRELKLAYRDCRITVVVQERNRELLETNPYVDRVLSPGAVGPSRLLRGTRTNWSILNFYLKSLLREDFDIALHPRLGPDYYGSDLLLALVNAPRTVRYEQVADNRLAARITRLAFRDAVNLPRPAARHEVLSNLALLEDCVADRCESLPRVFPTTADRQDAAGLSMPGSSDALTLCVAFGALARRRQWPLERWAAAVGEIALTRTLSVLVLCAASEAPQGEYLRSMLGVPSSLVAGAPLRQLSVLLEQSHLFLGPDSGLAHLAAAAGCPCVIVSPHPLQGDPAHENSPVRFSPWSEQARVLGPEAASPPCAAGCSAIKPHCILQVSSQQVAATAEQLLELRRPARRLSWHPPRAVPPRTPPAPPIRPTSINTGLGGAWHANLRIDDGLQR